MHAGITLRQIETFYWASRLQSFSAAAHQLNTTQPAISNRIRELETHLGLILFDRAGRSTSLTPEGRDFLDLAERFVELGDELVRKGRSQDSIRGILRIGAADTIALTWLPHLVAELSRQYPRLDVELHVDLSVHIQEKLSDGDLDIGFLVGAVPSAEFAEIQLGRVANAWMAAPGLKLFGRPVSPQELASFPIVTHSRGSHLHRTIKQWFAAAGVTRLRLHGCSSLASMIEMTAAGLGVAVLPPRMIQRLYAARELGVIETAASLPPTRFCCIHPRRTPSAVYEETVRIARRQVANDDCFTFDD
jgi:DNA-binding transcriptional LysR family regulator